MSKKIMLVGLVVVLIFISASAYATWDNEQKTALLKLKSNTKGSPTLSFMRIKDKNELIGQALKGIGISTLLYMNYDMWKEGWYGAPVVTGGTIYLISKDRVRKGKEYWTKGKEYWTTSDWMDNSFDLFFNLFSLLLSYNCYIMFKDDYKNKVPSTIGAIIGYWSITHVKEAEPGEIVTIFDDNFLLFMLSIPAFVYPSKSVNSTELEIKNRGKKAERYAKIVSRYGLSLIVGGLLMDENHAVSSTEKIKGVECSINPNLHNSQIILTYKWKF